MKASRLRKMTLGLAQRSQLDWLPIRKYLSGYSKADFRGDAKAGFNVALLAFPQGMAYALIAGLPIEYGVFGSAIATIAGFAFAGSRFISLGPTNATAVMLYSSFMMMGITSPVEAASYMPILLLMVGLFLLIGAHLRIAYWIQYVSQTVVTGYITAAAFLIISGQMKNVIGVHFAATEYAITSLDKVILTIKHLSEFHHESLVLSLITFTVFYLTQKHWPRLPTVAITLVVVSGLATGLSELAEVLSNRWVIDPFWSGEDIRWLTPINAQAWPITLPRINFDSIRQMSPVALAIALLCVLESTSIGKSLAVRSGEQLDTNQETFSIGMANLASAFFSGMPASGSLTRSQLSWSSGSRTPIVGLINGTIIIAGAFLVGPLIRYIPQSVLAVLVINIGIALIHRRAIKVVTTATRSDAATFFATLIAGVLFPLDTAIYLGVGISIILFLKKAGTPNLVEYGFTDEGHLAELETEQKRTVQEISIIHVEGDLFFGAAEFFRNQMRRISDDPNLKIVIVKMRNARHLDATAVMAIEELVNYMNSKDRHLLISECKKDIIRVFKNAAMLEILNRKNVFPDNPQNPTLSTAKALKRAQQILGGSEAKIKIYVNANKSKNRNSPGRC